MTYAANSTDIAVIGMSGRFPGADSVSEYWRNLRNGVESLTVLSEEELRQAGVSAETLQDPDYVRAAYLLKNADRFDSAFFGYSPREARFIDPQQRVLLECAWQALEHAGYGDGVNRPTGVYVGSSLNTYVLFTGLAEQFKTDPVLTLMSSDKDFLATRIGYKLQLEGPCLTVQTACSTSLVALHVACAAILAGECDLALAGGVCVKVPLHAGYMYREGGMLSRDGHCRTFDAKATGTIFGSGAGIVVLKRYADALNDGDTVHAVIKGTAINNDGGRKASYTAPSVVGLAEVIAQAMDFAQVKADAISYVECHGTGTALGDPIEVHGLAKAFRASTAQENFCALGSVKTNIGHLEAASGIASFIKTVCCLKNRYLPASLHFESANPALGLPGSPFFVNAAGREWPNGSGPRTAAINSLGVGGTNANVIVQEAPPQEAQRSRRRWHLLPVSAKTAAGLETTRADVARYMQEQPDLPPADAAFTLQAGRRAFDYRDVLFAEETESGRKLHLSLSDQPSAAQPKQVVFLFGEEFDANAAEVLSNDEPVFRRHLRELQQAGSESAQPGKASETFFHMAALAKLWTAWGVSPQAVLGHGIGALTAAYIAGVLPLSSALLALNDRTDNPNCSQDAYNSSAFYLATTPFEDGGGSCFSDIEPACRYLLDRYAYTALLPIGSAGVLTRTMESLVKASSTHTLIFPVEKGKECPGVIWQQAAKLWKSGAHFDGTKLYEGENRRRVPMPVTAFSGNKHWWSTSGRS